MNSNQIKLWRSAATLKTSSSTLRKALAFAALAIGASAGSQAGQPSYPAPGKPVQIVVPFAPGSGTDTMARALAEDLQKALGTPVVIANRPGANGAVAAEFVRKATPDGYTLVLATSSGWSTNTWLLKAVSYDPVRDFTPIARTTNFPFVLVVSASSSIRTLDDFLDRARASQLTMGYGNATGQVAGAHLMKVAGFEALPVPYGSTPPALVDLIGGRFDFMFVDIASSQTLIESGKVRPLAVMADQRSSLMPQLPALGETYPGFDYVPWGGLMGPQALPSEITDKLGSITVAILRHDELKARMAALGLEAYPAGSAQFGTFVQEQLRAWGDKVKEAGLEPQ
ncbi:tripartite tricarboxylate transporter substrate binding protein [Verticiella sediminum]|uniref:Tripartite tricarboxylate transporter substrate binding protein n=1 Tax=Verticiella sediminum TaxID=1247510 RepID=A0A556AZK1_9BURK|nr:tripartite tricarboxylate transporter substrate binding protein [Verticiella sediminum]TSH98359.1 tripartite tricarboxylate transporter substrate binding protein [Verticiella sediminum]